MKKFLALSLVALAAMAASLVGCTEGVFLSHQAIHPPPRMMTPRAWDQVEVHKTPPRRPYVEVVLLEVRQDLPPESAHSPMSLLKWMRESAGRLGCDGLLLGATTSDSAPSPGVMSLSGSVDGSLVMMPRMATHWLYSQRTTCIVYRHPREGLAGGGRL